MVVLLALFLLLLGVGCSSDDDDPIVVAPTGAVEGNWDFYYGPDGGPEMGPELLEITQSGEMLTITRYPVDGPPVNGDGTVTGDQVEISDARLSFSGTLNGDSLSGEWTNADGENGIWSAMRLPDGDPVVLLNLGDSLANGVQSGAVNEFTQVNGYTQFLAEQMDAAAFTIWRNPLLSPEGARLHPEYLPFNLGVNGANTQDVLQERTGEGNLLLDALLSPIPELAGGPVSQLEAAEYLASLYPGKRKIITLWIGNNDVLGTVFGGNGTRLTADAIQAYLSDTAAGHDLASVTANLTEIVERLTAIPEAEVLIANIPDVSQIAFLLTAADLERLAVFPDPQVTALGPEEALGFGPFLNPAAPDQSVARALGANNVVLNGTLLGTRGVSEAFVLTPAEGALIQERVAELNGLLADLAAAKPNARLVDVGALLDQVLNGEITVAGNNLTRTWGGGIFSLDGVHLSNTGYATVANAHVDALNAAFPELGVPSLDLVPVWENDPYRDKDGDGYVYGPEFPPVIAPELLPLADCDDADPNVWPTYISGTPCP